MNCLLTFAGIRNKSILDALVDLLGKPIAESDALFVPPRSIPSPEVLVWRGRRSAEKVHPLCANWVGNSAIQKEGIILLVGYHPGNSD